MPKFLTLLTILFLLLFYLRVQSIGGFNPKTKEDPLLESTSEVFLPFRNYLSSQFKEIFPEPHASLMSGILLGEKSTLDKDFKKALVNTSTIHIVVVSGQNLSLLAGFILSFASLIGRKKTILLGIIICVLYSVLTGLQIPVLRALIMVLFGFLTTLLGREKDSIYSIFLAAFLLLLYNPNWLFSISFQLSMAATVGVVVVAPLMVKTISFLPEIIREDLAVSLAAQALTWPIIAANFHQVSILGVFVNTLVLWTINLIMVSGILILILGPVVLILAYLISFLPLILLTYFVDVVIFFNNLSITNIYFPKVPIILWVGYYLILCGILLLIYQKNKQKEDISIL